MESYNMVNQFFFIWKELLVFKKKILISLFYLFKHLQNFRLLLKTKKKKKKKQRRTTVTLAKND